MQITKKIAKGVVATTLLAGTGVVSSGIYAVNAIADEATAQDVVQSVNGYSVEVQLGDTQDEFVAESNVSGDFTFDQAGVTPADDMFNIFGTTISSLCSKSADELSAEQESGAARYFINVGGNMEEQFTVDVSSMSGSEKKQTIGCSCATGGGFGQVAVVGVPLSTVVEMADLEDGVNTVTAYGSDGFGTPLPLKYALDHDALLVYEVNGKPLVTTSETGSSVALFMPETVARYFTRDIASIEFTRESEEPAVMQVDPNLRNKVNIQNYADGVMFAAGDSITFSGQADDLGSPIESIELSFDGGRTWTSCETTGATADRWVNWSFTTSFENTGAHILEVRARTADGVVSPLEATLHFDVE